jgi:hypothetical protein
MSTPRVSVIMAVYNGERWLGISMPSVLEQDFRDFEFIIVDDCSTDATPALIAAYADPRVVYVRNECNLGQTASLNRAIGLARADLIARIDADDLWLPGKLGKQMAFLDAHPEVTVLGTWATRIDLEGRSLGPNNSPVSRAEVTARLLRGVPVCHVSIIMRRAAAQAAGSYPERYRFAADYGLWSAMARAGAVITNIPERLTCYRENPATFGAAQKLGVAGDESAEIIRANALALAKVDVSLDECREIALMFFPAAGLPAESLPRATRTLRRLQRAALGRRPWRLEAELWALLLWALSKRWSTARANRQPMAREWWALFGRNLLRPVTAAIVLLAGLGSLGGGGGLHAIKSLLSPLTLGRRR